MTAPDQAQNAGRNGTEILKSALFASAQGAQFRRATTVKRFTSPRRYACRNAS
jgi:hypothetical protein